jgi:hypothetical protein
MFKTLKYWIATLTLVIGSPLWAQQPIPLCSVEISLVHDNVRSGDQIIVKAKVTNITNHAVTLAHEMGHEAEYEFKVAVRDGDGSLAPMTKNGQYFWKDDSALEGDWIDELLEPGKSVVLSVNLTELYDLKPGSYHVQLSEGALISNVISLRVVP